MGTFLRMNVCQEPLPERLLVFASSHVPGSFNLLLQPGQGPAHHQGLEKDFSLSFYKVYQSLSDTKTSCWQPAEEKLTESSGFSALKQKSPTDTSHHPPVGSGKCPIKHKEQVNLFCTKKMGLI